MLPKYLNFETCSISCCAPVRHLLECLSSHCGEIALSHSSDDSICTVDRRVTEIDCLRASSRLTSLSAAVVCSRTSLAVAIRHTGSRSVLHSNGLVHCDLRADNILWDQDKPFLTDLEQVHKAGFEVLLRHPLYSLIRRSHISNTSSQISHVDPAARALPPNCFIVA